MIVLVRRAEIFVYALLLVVSLAAVLVGGSVPASHVGALPKPIERGPDVPAVALAVNVVWGEAYVLPIAEVLRARGARATFFLGGRFAEAHPEIARQLVGLGMELGNHGYSHRHVGRLSLAANEEEIARAEAAIRRATGIRTTLYEPAYGEVSPAVLEAAGRLGYRVVLWTVDTVDWRPHMTASAIATRVLSRVGPGAIVLIHPTDRTLAALPRLLEGLSARGLRVESVGALLAEEVRKLSASRALAREDEGEGQRRGLVLQ